MLKYVFMVNMLLILTILFIINIKIANVSKNNQKNIISNTEIFLMNILNHIPNNNIKQPSINDNYVIPDVTIKYSNKIYSRGVFANKNYKKNDIIEICPCIKLQKITTDNNQIHNYVFELNNEYCIIAFGYCSLYNHSDTPNAKWSIIDENQMKITVLSDIQQNEEIFMSYGKNYWISRNYKI